MDRLVVILLVTYIASVSLATYNGALYQRRVSRQANLLMMENFVEVAREIARATANVYRQDAREVPGLDVMNFDDGHLVGDIQGLDYWLNPSDGSLSLYVYYGEIRKATAIINLHEVLDLNTSRRIEQLVTTKREIGLQAQAQRPTHDVA